MAKTQWSFGHSECNRANIPAMLQEKLFKLLSDNQKYKLACVSVQYLEGLRSRSLMQEAKADQTVQVSWLIWASTGQT